jgi:ATP-dependent DNA helicase RecG
MKENQHIEWKESWRDDYLKWIYGFANGDGGVLVIGRNDKGLVVGVTGARKLMIWNPGQLPPEWTLEKLLGKHSSQPFNPDLANTFFRAGMIEAWGRGIERMMDACAAAGTPVPDFEAESTGLWAVFHFLSQQVVGATTQTPVKTPERIIEMLEANPAMSLADVATAIGKSLRAVERASAKMMKENRLRYIGPTKGGHWEVLP